MKKFNEHLKGKVFFTLIIITLAQLSTAQKQGGNDQLGDIIKITIETELEEIHVCDCPIGFTNIGGENCETIECSCLGGAVINGLCVPGFGWGQIGDLLCAILLCNRPRFPQIPLPPPPPEEKNPCSIEGKSCNELRNECIEQMPGIIEQCRADRIAAAEKNCKEGKVPELSGGSTLGEDILMGIWRGDISRLGSKLITGTTISKQEACILLWLGEGQLASGSTLGGSVFGFGITVGSSSGAVPGRGLALSECETLASKNFNTCIQNVYEKCPLDCLTQERQAIQQLKYFFDNAEFNAEVVEKHPVITNTSEYKKLWIDQFIEGLSQAWLEKKMYAEALTFLRVNVERYPYKAETHLALAKGYIHYGANYLAEEELEFALKLDPNLLEAKKYLSTMK